MSDTITAPGANTQNQAQPAELHLVTVAGGQVLEERAVQIRSKKND